MPRYPIQSLLAVPIEYIGGNSLVLLAGLAIVAVGLVTLVREPDGDRRRLRVNHPAEGLMLIVWAAVPPGLMFAYSHLGQPIFGPSRYHLYQRAGLPDPAGAGADEAAPPAPLAARRRGSGVVDGAPAHL